MDLQEFKKLCEGKEVTIKAEDLLELLTTINGPPHYLREQMVIMDMQRKINGEHFMLNLENALKEQIIQGESHGGDNSV